MSETSVHSSDVVETPPMSLRGGAAINDYHVAPPFDIDADLPTQEYLETNHWGLSHLDPASWRYYLPIFVRYALSNIANAESRAVEAFLASLRPPDREPPRFASLSADHEASVVEMLDRLAFEEVSTWKPQAMLALEEYWAPGALYRAPRDNLLAEIRLVFPFVPMPSKLELRFHPKDCLQCQYLSEYLDERRTSPIDGTVIRYLHQEMTCLSAKGWCWTLPHYLPYCLTPEAEYNRTETEYLVYNLGPSDEHKDAAKLRLSSLSKAQVRCLQHFISWLSRHPEWKEYFPEDIANAADFLRQMDRELDR